MANYLTLIRNPQIDHRLFFEVLRDFRKGGVHPDMWDTFMADVRSVEGNEVGPEVFARYHLGDISEEDYKAIMAEIRKRAVDRTKKCWHPEASSVMCDIDESGRIVVSLAHSIQNNGVLNRIAKNGEVVTFDFEQGALTCSTRVGRRIASVFFGFCNRHDAVFRPIETKRYDGSPIQSFLFAYRAFVIAAHTKLEMGLLFKWGSQSDIDIERNRLIFDEALTNRDYDRLVTHRFTLPLFYPLAAASAFYVEHDFDGNRLCHSDERMEYLYLTVFPTPSNGTEVLISYLRDDEGVYAELARQIHDRDNLKSDVTMLLVGHCGNIYFHPDYYEAFIQRIESTISTIVFKTQTEAILGQSALSVSHSLTPPDYLNNPWGISIFGY